MSIAEKLITIAENEQRVYDAGYSAGKASGGGSSVDPDKIIEKTVTGTMIAVDNVSEVNHQCTITNLSDKDVTVKVCGKNLFDFQSGTYEISYISSAGTLRTYKGYAIHLPPGTYTLHAEVVKSGDDYLYGCVCDATNNFKRSCTLVAGTNRYTETINIDDGDVLYMYNGIASNTIAQSNAMFARYNTQIEAGNASTPYEPFYIEQYEVYAGQSITVDSICPNMSVYSTIGAELSFEYRVSWGMQTEYDRFWDTVQENGNRTDYDFAFAGEAWDGITFKPKYRIAPTTCYNMFAYWGQYAPVLDTKPLVDFRRFDLDFSNSTQLNSMFLNNRMAGAVGVVDGSKNASFQSVFDGARKLHTVEQFIVRDNYSFTNTFNNCLELQHITFGGVISKNISFAQSSKLTTESVQSIIDHLKDLTGATAQTLTFHATVGGKLTDAQKAAVTAKNWTLVY